MPEMKTLTWPVYGVLGASNTHVVNGDPGKDAGLGKVADRKGRSQIRCAFGTGFAGGAGRPRDRL